MNLSEADTRAKLIDPVLHHRGWTEDLIRREETDRSIDIVDGKPRRRQKGRIDYLLRIRININSQPIAVALIEAKRSNESPDKGLEQAKKYALLNYVPFVYSSNGHLFVEYNNFTGKTSDPRLLEEFPTPLELRQRYEKGVDISLDNENIKPLLVPYIGGEASRRYYQDAAIRAALTKIVKGENRVLLYLATGSGKTFIAVHLLKKIADAGQLRRALFICDRDELRTQGLGAFQNIFGADAVQIGLTATPRYWKSGTEEKRKEDEEITANNLQYFGKPVYEYDMAQGIKDGYLPACEIIRRVTDLDERGVTREDIERLGAKDTVTGQPLMVSEAKEHYGATSFEAAIQLPDRVKAWCKDLFDMILQTGDPHQKTVIFCVRDTHADAVAAEMNNLYADWCSRNGQKRLEPYAFKCTASVGGSEYIADLRGSERSHFIATTVDLITTGVDVPILRNVVFFKYVRSPISFQQMMGRGSRIHLPTNKLMFRVYDYTNATRLLGKDYLTKPTQPRPPGPPTPPEKIIRVEGFDVHINPAGTYIVTEKEGRLTMVTVEEYKEKLAEHLVKEAKTFDDFHNCRINPQERKRLIDLLPDDGRGIRLLRELLNLKEYDLYDVLAEIGFGVAPKSRKKRVEALHYKHDTWFKSLPTHTANTLLALARQFERGGTEELENPHIFNAPDVIKEGGIEALKVLGDPKDIIDETKKRLFAV
ncbi:MAG: DEAD/DEAH box helicase family protein [Nitrospinota bacterium]